jgi:hypothetical protein
MLYKEVEMKLEVLQGGREPCGKCQHKGYCPVEKDEKCEFYFPKIDREKKEQEMNRFAFQKENGEVLRLILSKEQQKVEEFMMALGSWKRSMKLFSTGEDTKVRQNGQIVFSDDILDVEGVRWHIIHEEGKWLAQTGELKMPLQTMVDHSFIIEPYPPAKEAAKEPGIS